VKLPSVVIAPASLSAKPATVYSTGFSQNAPRPGEILTQGLEEFFAVEDQTHTGVVLGVVLPHPRPRPRAPEGQFGSVPLPLVALGQAQETLLVPTARHLVLDCPEHPLLPLTVVAPSARRAERQLLVLEGVAHLRVGVHQELALRQDASEGRLGARVVTHPRTRIEKPCHASKIAGVPDARDRLPRAGRAHPALTSVRTSSATSSAISM